MASKRTIESAIRTITGIQEINKNEQIVHGEYVTEDATKPELAGAICGGHAACLLGSAAIASPVRISLFELSNRWDWEDYVRRSPSLKLAATALDEEATKRLRKIAKRGRGERRTKAEIVVESIDAGDYVGGETYPLEGRIAEAYFEDVLGHDRGSRNIWDSDTHSWRLKNVFAKKSTRDEIHDLCKAAKRNLRKRLR